MVLLDFPSDGAICIRDNPPVAHTTSRTYPLIECPEVVAGTVYRLLQRDNHEGDVILLEERATAAAPSLNLARIRHLGACLGASCVELTITE